MTTNDISRQSGVAAESVEPVAVALEDFLHSMHKLSTTLGESKFLASNGIGISEWAVLKVLGNRKEVQQHIIRRSGVSRQRIRKLLQELEAKKLVTVMRSSGDDKRQRVVAATPRGMKTRRAVLARLDELASELDGSVRTPGRDPAKLAKRLQTLTRFSDRVSNVIRRRNANKAVEDWSDDKDS